jgi:predicted TIM-barrel enzyme
VAQACGLQFIRAEGFVFSHVADEGFTDATAGPLLRYRASIRADNILIFTDIKKKHRQVPAIDLHVIFPNTPKILMKFGVRDCSESGSSLFTN